ncbi:MAG TPA: homocysteine S-methyltransferase family protein, partial [Myxococcota bacterium]|nr:homocysteine S-methyltransferase family protein [Myxococcota bacterium]
MKRGAAWLADRLGGAGDPVAIDGGMGTQLQRSGVPMHGKVWSGAAVLTHPEAVRRAHEDFIRAGAEVIITNTFAAGRHMLEPGGLGEHVRAINTQAVHLAQQARDAVAERPVAILGSICEWAFPGESRWSTPAGVAESAAEQAQLLCAAGVDALALEMCQRVELSSAVVEAALQTGLPIWIGVSARRRPGAAEIASFDFPERDLDELVRALARYPAMLLAVMHTPVPDVAEALDGVRRHWQGALGVYPESGYFEMPNWRFVDVIAPDALAEAAKAWLRAGVRAIGGCC